MDFISKLSVLNIKPEKIKGLLILLVTFLLCQLLFLLFSNFSRYWENLFTDNLLKIRFQIMGREEISPYMIHLYIDDQSREALQINTAGRQVYTRVINQLQEMDVAVMGFDILFSEFASPGEDTGIIQATKQAGNVYFPAVFLPPFKNQPQADYPEPLTGDILWQLKITKSGEPFTSPYLRTPYPELFTAAAGIGHINCIPDRDGINRSFPLIFRYDRGWVPSITFRMVCDYIGITPRNMEVRFQDAVYLYNARLPGDLRQDIRIPIDKQGRIILNYPAAWQESFYEISVQDFLESAADAEKKSQLYDIMEGTLVFISDISTRNKDIGVGVFEPIYPLGGIHLTLARSHSKRSISKTAQTDTDLRRTCIKTL